MLTEPKTDYGSTTIETLKDSSSNKEDDKCCNKNWQIYFAAISGILPEYGNTVGDSLIVPYLLELGAPTWSTSYVWVITPFIDSWMQPIYGKASDKYTKTKNSCFKLGGRKPFIILFGLFATIGLIVIPQARSIKKFGHIALAVIICILSYTLMDMSHGDLLIPTRALLNDLCPNIQSMKFANEQFSFFQAIGRCLGYIVVSINWKTFIQNNQTLTPFGQFLKSLHLDHHVSICFTLSIFILWIIILIVMIGTPNQIQRLTTSSSNRNSRKRIMAFNYGNNNNKNNNNNNTSNEMLITPSGRVVILHPTSTVMQTITSILSSDHGSRIFDYRTDEEEEEEGEEEEIDHDIDDDDDDIEPLSGFELNESIESDQKDQYLDVPDIDGINEKDPLSPINEKKAKSARKFPNTDKLYDKQKEKESENEDEDEISWRFPAHFKLLWTVQFFGWCNFAAFSLYFTSFMAVDIYGGDPNINSDRFTQFETGIRSATSILLISTIIAAIFGRFILPILNTKIGVKLTFFIGELMLNVLLILLLFGQTNIIFIIIITCFYGLFIQIHYNNVFIIFENDLREIFNREDQRAYVLAVFNLAILFANVTVSLLAGWIIKVFDNQFVWGISFFGICGIIGDIVVVVIAMCCHEKYQHLFDRKRSVTAHSPTFSPRFSPRLSLN